MKRRQVWRAIWICAATFPLLDWNASLRAETVLSVSAQSLDLMQCYELAKKQSETLQIQVEQIEQLEQQYRQVLGSVMPNLSFNASQKYQEKNPNGGGLAPTSNPLVDFTLTQPIFSGFREFAAMRAFKHQGETGRLQLKFADEQLFQNVFNAFYLTLNLEKNLEDTKALRNMTNDRVKELRAREELGKSRVSEVLSVESQLATVDSQMELLKGQIAAAREMLSFLIGRDVSDAPLVDNLPAPTTIESQDSMLQKAQSRSDVAAARELEESQRLQMKVAWGSWYPQIGFVGDYYLKRIPFYEPIKWDAAFNLSLPVFSGGSMLAQVRQAESQWKAAKDSTSLTLRQARSQIRTDYLNLQYALSQFRTLKEAYEKARDSYKLEVREYRLGIVDNLTVLQAMNTMQSAQLAMDQTAYQIKIDYLLLKVATEELP